MGLLERVDDLLHVCGLEVEDAEHFDRGGRVGARHGPARAAAGGRGAAAAVVAAGAAGKYQRRGGGRGESGEGPAPGDRGYQGHIGAVPSLSLETGDEAEESFGEGVRVDADR